MTSDCCGEMADVIILSPFDFTIRLCHEAQMGKINLNSNEKQAEIIALLEKSKHLVLATCADNRVTARTMGFASKGLEIIFGTDKRFLKVEQIKQNPKVALCLDSLQIEGVAEILGHPSEPQNDELSKLYKAKQPKSFEMYWAGKTQVVIKVTPSLCTQWKYIDGKPCREFYDVKQGVAYRENFEVII